MIHRVAVGIVLGWACVGFGQAAPRASGGAESAPSVKAGPVRITATRSNVLRAVVFGREVRRESTTTLLLRVVADPNLVVPFLSDFKLDALTDQAGHPLKGALQKNVYLSLMNHQLVLPVEIPELPAEVTDIGRIAFSFNAAVAEVQKVEFTDLRPNRTNTRQSPRGDSVSVTLHPTEDGFEVEMRAAINTNDPAAAQQMSRAFSDSSLSVLDASGNVLRSHGGSTSGGPGQVRRTSNYRTGAGTPNASAGEPAKVVFEMPVSLKTVPVAGELKELALP